MDRGSRRDSQKANARDPVPQGSIARVFATGPLHKSLKQNNSLGLLAVRPTHKPLPLKVFFLAISAGLFASTLTGLYMSYKYCLRNLITAGLLLCGIVIPSP